MYFGDVTGKNNQDSVGLQRRHHNEDSSWRCDCGLGQGGPRQSDLRLMKQRRRPGKSGSFPSILQRQRDVRGRWPFPANQRGEERTPPCTSAQAAMRFPCLCWLVEVRQYLYPLWQRTGELIFWLCEGEVKKSLVCLSSPKFWVNFPPICGFV